MPREKKIDQELLKQNTEILKKLVTIEKRITALEDGGVRRTKKRPLLVPLGEKFELNPLVAATLYGTGVDRLGNISLEK